MTHLKRAAGKCAVLAFWLLVWAGLARLVGRELLLPGPLAVFKRLLVQITGAEFWRITGITLLRIVLGAVCAVVMGPVLAALTCRFRAADALLSPLLKMVRATPVASFILLVLIWVGRDILPSVVVFLIVLPVVWENVAAGIRGVDPKMLELARVYRFPGLRTVEWVYVPAVMPYFLSACRTALGLAWKSGVAAEVLTVPKHAVGRMLYESKLYMETTDLFAWTVVVVLCSVIIEKLLMAAIGRVSERWKGGKA